MLISVAPIQRAPGDDATAKIRLVPPDDVREVLDHLDDGEPAKIAEVQKVDGENGSRVKEEVEPLTDQILPRQHP